MTRSRRASGYEEDFDGLARIAHRVAFRLLGDRHEADDVAQEALARAYVRWRRVEPYADAWVARVASNLALDLHRRRARARRHQARTPVASDPEADRSEGLVTRMELVAGLRALPRRQREAVVLRYVADVSEADTAELLGCAPGTVKQHAHRGLAALRLSVTEPDAAEPVPDPDGAPPPSPSPVPRS